MSMLVQLIRHLDSKGKNQQKLYKNEMIIMREKHMRKKKIGNMRKGSNFVRKMMMMGPE